MRIIAVIESEDCGPFVILDADAMSIVKCSDFYIAATFCAFTGRAITVEISSECANELIKNGVRCLDFNEEISDNTTVEKKATD